jgi:hypothetical protein
MLWLNTNKSKLYNCSSLCIKLVPILWQPADSNECHFGYGASLGGTLCHTHNLTVRLFSYTCLHTMSDDDQTRLHKKHKQHDKQHHHGGGVARPSSGVDLINPCRPRGGRPSAYFFQCCCPSDLIDSIT